MSDGLNLEGRFEPDEKVEIHENAVKQLAGRIASHDAGLSELVKNACDAYSEAELPSTHKVIVILLKSGTQSQPAIVGCLDFVGMTTEKIEGRFKNWGDPSAASGGKAGKRQGGHGHGGKAYMVNMFKDHALLLTCYGGYGNRYGFKNGEIRPGFFPDRNVGRRFPVADRRKLLAENLAPFDLSVESLPPDALISLDGGSGFTLVKGVEPKDFSTDKSQGAELVAQLAGHSQMIEALQEAAVYVFMNGHPVDGGSPIRLEHIEPMEGPQSPKQFGVPASIRHGVVDVSTTDDGRMPEGRLVLQTSKASMRWKLASRHRVYIHARDEYVGSWDVRDLAGKGAADNIYGDLFLDSLVHHKTSDRVEPADSLLTRAIKEWTRGRIDAYGQEFEKYEKLKATQKDRDEWQRVSERLNEWKNQFFDRIGLGVGKGPGDAGSGSDSRRLPKDKVKRIHLRLSHEFSGIGVAIQPSLEFYNKEDERVRSIPFRWCSSDWGVATVDDDLFRVVTHSPGQTEVWAESLEDDVKSNKIPLNVLDIKSVNLRETSVEIPAGRFKALDAEVEDREGNVRSGVYLNWIASNTDVARVGEAGVVWAVAVGTAEVTAGDDRAMAAPGAIVRVVEGSGSGRSKSRGYPRILLSGIDADPLSPDKEPEQLFTRRFPPIAQRVVPDDLENGIWWINMAAPLAQRYWKEASGESPKSDKVRQWRVYYLERFVEAMVKIRLYTDYKMQGQNSWDQLLDRWDGLVVEVQEELSTEFESFLEAGNLPEVK